MTARPRKERVPRKCLHSGRMHLFSPPIPLRHHREIALSFARFSCLPEPAPPSARPWSARQAPVGLESASRFRQPVSPVCDPTPSPAPSLARPFADTRPGRGDLHEHVATVSPTSYPKKQGARNIVSLHTSERSSSQAIDFERIRNGSEAEIGLKVSNSGTPLECPLSRPAGRPILAQIGDRFRRLGDTRAHLSDRYRPGRTSGSRSLGKSPVHGGRWSGG
jgi:hypothetical protein